jgi:hypothetical protein
MNLWMLWKSGPDREADGALATHLVAATDSLEALFRRGEHLAERHGLTGSGWVAAPDSVPAYQLGSAAAGVFFVIEPEPIPRRERQASAPPHLDNWLDEACTAIVEPEKAFPNPRSSARPDQSSSSQCARPCTRRMPMVAGFGRPVGVFAPSSSTGMLDDHVLPRGIVRFWANTLPPSSARGRVQLRACADAARKPTLVRGVDIERVRQAHRRERQPESSLRLCERERCESAHGRERRAPADGLQEFAT